MQIELRADDTLTQKNLTKLFMNLFWQNISLLLVMVTQDGLREQMEG